MILDNSSIENASKTMCTDHVGEYIVYIQFWIKLTLAKYIVKKKICESFRKLMVTIKCTEKKMITDR
jgi:hypothetical protein